MSSRVPDNTAHYAARLAHMQERMDAIERETIERCARTAERCVRFGGLRDNAVCDYVAKEIRALAPLVGVPGMTAYE